MPRVVVVTGASAGVGRATAVAFAHEGDDVALLARGREALECAREEVERAGGRALVAPVDVADAAQVEEAAARVERELGPIDVWVNDAMTTVFAPFWEITPEEFERATRVTYLGTVHGTMSALARMRPRNRGVVVQVGSALAYRAIPLQSPYCGAKHAVKGFTESILSELIHENSAVRVTMVHLPGLNTPQFGWCRSKLERHPQPVPPIYQPEVAARAVVWASRHRRRELYVGWPVYKTIWGQKIAPWFLDRYLARNAWEGQQTDEVPAGPRTDNLFAPVPGDHGAHGVFDARAKTKSPFLWLATHRRGIAAALVACVAVALIAAAAR